jgi:membrane-bound lytic murein transglycosylase
MNLQIQSNYSNTNTINLEKKLNQIGKTEKTAFNRLRNFTPGSKSQTFLNKITEIITSINPKDVVEYHQANHKKIIKIAKLLSEFKGKKENFTDLIRQAEQIETNIKEMIQIFEEKEKINKVNLNPEIKEVLKGQFNVDKILKNEKLTKQEKNDKFKKEIMSIYKQFIDAYIKNYELAIESRNNVNKSKFKEQIKLLDSIHKFFYIYYKELANLMKSELGKKKFEINILKKYIELNDYVQPNKSKPIVDIQNKSEISQVFMDLANHIYELALITKDLKKFKLLKDMLYNLHDKYLAIFIEPQINRNKNQTIASFNGPYSNTYNNLGRKYNELNKKLNQSKMQNATTNASTNSSMTKLLNLGY